VALRNIEIMEREGLVQRTGEVTGPYFSQALRKLHSHAIVGEVRSLGLIGAVEIVRQPGTNLRFGDKEGTAGTVLRDRCIANGLMVRAVRDSIVVCPPLIITETEIDRLVEIFDKSLTETAALLQ
jgi:putrescine aminotransferase